MILSSLAAILSFNFFTLYQQYSHQYSHPSLQPTKSERSTTRYTDARKTKHSWKGDALQRAMDANCNSDLLNDKVNCPTLKLQSIKDTNKCTLQRRVKEDIDSWLKELPGAKDMQMRRRQSKPLVA
jgi:hypothetical protein